ncbi:MAG: hypothetical protein GYA36_23185, partial [Veillonellaceae bacterium]|nr:hypothetical protein [Veillonellaceae bacterium]
MPDTPRYPRQMTHYAGCWQHHHACAIAWVNRLSARLVVILDNPELCDDPVWQQETRAEMAWLNSEERVPAVIVRPCEILRDEMRARGMSAKGLAFALAYPKDAVVDLLNDKVPITEGIAESLERALGISAQFWLNLQATYDRR